MVAAFPSLALVKRELLSLLRGPRAMGVVLLFSIIATIFVWMNWPKNADEIRWAPWLAQNYALGFMFMMFFGTILCVPAFAAGAIVLERERGTFELLRMTLARPWGVIVSKLVNATGFFLLLMVGLAPVFGTIFFLVGFDLRQLLSSLAIIACTAVTCAAMGLFCSAFARRTLVAIGLSYLGLAATVLLPLALTLIVSATLSLFFDMRSVWAEVERVFFIVMPLAIMENITSSGTQTSILPHLAYQAVITIVCLYLAWRLVARPQRPPKIELRKPVDDKKVLRERRTTWPYYLVDPLRRKKSIEDGRNAMLVREIRWGLINRGSILIRIFYIAATIYFFSGVMTAIDFSPGSDTFYAWFMVQIVLTVLVAPALTANSVTKELELGNIDMLRMTLLRPWEVIAGKFVAAIFSVLPVLAAAVVSIVPVVIMSRPGWVVLTMGYGTLMVCTAISLSIAIFFSTALRRTLPAVIWSYVVSALAFAGFAIATAFANEYNGYGPNYYDQNVQSLTSPMVVLNRGFELIQDDQNGFGYWVGGMALWLGIAGMLFSLSIYIFARHRMRDR